MSNQQTMPSRFLNQVREQTLSYLGRRLPKIKSKLKRLEIPSDVQTPQRYETVLWYPDDLAGVSLEWGVSQYPLHHRFLSRFLYSSIAYSALNNNLYGYARLIQGKESYGGLPSDPNGFVSDDFSHAAKVARASKTPGLREDVCLNRAIDVLLNSSRRFVLTSREAEEVDDSLTIRYTVHVI